MATIKNSFLNILIKTKKYNYDLLKAIYISIHCISSSVRTFGLLWCMSWHNLWSLCDSDRPLIQLHVPLILIVLHYDINQMMLLLYHNHIFLTEPSMFNSDHWYILSRYNDMGWIIKFDHDSPWYACYVPMEYDMTKETLVRI